MRRFFYLTAVVLICVFLFALCAACDGKAVTKAYPELKAETALYTASNGDFFMYVKQFINGEYCTDNCSYRYNYIGFSITLVPLNIHAEKGGARVVFQGESIDFCDGEFTVYRDGSVDADGIIFVAGDRETEIFLECDSEVDCEKIIALLRETRGDKLSDDGRIEIRHLLDYRGLFVFCGYYRSDELVCAVLCDADGELITYI